jgi:hypothetical protein
MQQIANRIITSMLEIIVKYLLPFVSNREL